MADVGAYRAMVAHLRERLARTQEHCRRLAHEARMWERFAEGQVERGNHCLAMQQRAEAERDEARAEVLRLMSKLAEAATGNIIWQDVNRRIASERDAATAREAVLKARIRELEGSR